MKDNGLKLDVEKVSVILEHLGRTKSWLAERAGMSRQLLDYDFKSACPKRVSIYARILGVKEPYSLLKD